MKTEPIWINELLEAFLTSVEWTSLKTPINHTFTYRCQNIDGAWEIIVSPWIHEIYGGKNDGALKLPTYEVNLLTIVDKFDTVDYIGFDTDRLEATIEGEIDSSYVSLVFRKLAPKSKVRKKINTYTGEVTKIVERSI